MTLQTTTPPDLGAATSGTARICAAAKDVAVVLVRDAFEAAFATDVHAPDSDSRYAEGYFDGLCFALAVLTDSPPDPIAAQLLDFAR